MREEAEPERIGLYVQSEDDTDAVYVSIPRNQLQIWDEEAEEMGVSRSEAIRAWSEAGRKMLDQYDPTSESRNSNDSENPITKVILDEVGVGENNSKSIDEIAESVKEKVEEEALDLLYESEEVENTGREFYKP
jgi:metal-responsive CopG/Arc/MetJ family transcriptional regulator